MIGLLETAAIAVSGFLVKKYVFLEADMEEKKQRIFYWISLLLTAAAFLVFGKDTASLTAVFLIGLNVLLAKNAALSICGLRSVLFTCDPFLRERKSMAQMVSGEYAVQEPSEIRKCPAMGDRYRHVLFFE